MFACHKAAQLRKRFGTHRMVARSPSLAAMSRLAAMCGGVAVVFRVLDGGEMLCRRIPRISADRIQHGSSCVVKIFICITNTVKYYHISNITTLQFHLIN